MSDRRHVRKVAIAIFGGSDSDPLMKFRSCAIIIGLIAMSLAIPTAHAGAVGAPDAPASTPTVVDPIPPDKGPEAVPEDVVTVNERAGAGNGRRSVPSVADQSALAALSDVPTRIAADLPVWLARSAKIGQGQRTAEAIAVNVVGSDAAKSVGIGAFGFQLNRPVFCIMSGLVLGRLLASECERSTRARTRRVGCRRARCGVGGC